MTRAALMPSPGDPFLNKLWFKLFEKYWQDEVDKLYVLVNSKIETEVIEFLRTMYESNPKVQFTYVDHMIEHGWALKDLVLQCEEDLVMLIEDDGLIFKSGAVKEQFDKIESGQTDIVAGHRQSSTPRIAERVQHVFYTESLESFMWPNFLFTKREYLLKTDLVLGSKGFKRGEIVPILDCIFEEDQAMDTFGWAAIQLYAQHLNVEFIEQYHAMPHDDELYQKRERTWNGQAKWCHLGSLSSMMNNFLFDDMGYPLEYRKNEAMRAISRIDPYDIKNSDDITNEGTRIDFESRVASVMLAFELTEKECDEIAEFREQYKGAIERLIIAFKLHMDRINLKIQGYKELFGL